MRKNLDNKLYDQIEAPYLIQRAWLETNVRQRGTSLQYDYMGAAEFEWGGPQDALWAIFDAGTVRHEVTVQVDGRNVTLYVITRDGFSISDYAPHLQALAADTCHLHEPSFLKEKIQLTLGTNTRPMSWAERINVWFDINNATLITLSSEDADQLEAVLADIKKAWLAKA